MPVFDIYGAYFLLATILCVAYSLLILSYTIRWLNMKNFNYQALEQPNTSVSIIVAARNEEDNITRCLKGLLDQDYPKELYEIIIADDNSSDNTVLNTSNFFSENPAMGGKVIELAPLDLYGKKEAITAGIAKANGSLIVTTDADCYAGNKWLSCLVLFYETHHPKMICAPISLNAGKSIFQKLQELEFAGLMVATGASIEANRPIMCNGANLCYEKKVFQAIDSYHNNKDIPSGDDVFLMHKINHEFPGGVRFLKHPEATVYTNSVPTPTAFLNQRKRWTSKIKHMNDLPTLIIAAVVYFMNFILFVGLLFWGFLPDFNETLFILIFGAKSIVDFLFLFVASTFFNKRNLTKYFLPGEILNVFYVTIVGAMGSISRYNWKERLVKNIR